jgi:hypothetical protein
MRLAHRLQIVRIEEQSLVAFVRLAMVHGRSGLDDLHLQTAFAKWVLPKVILSEFLPSRGGLEFLPWPAAGHDSTMIKHTATARAKATWLIVSLAIAVLPQRAAWTLLERW